MKEIIETWYIHNRISIYLWMQLMKAILMTYLLRKGGKLVISLPICTT